LNGTRRGQRSKHRKKKIPEYKVQTIMQNPRFHASAGMLNRSVLFWDITQRRMVIT
jgi:hypothetical protein